MSLACPSSGLIFFFTRSRRRCCFLVSGFGGPIFHQFLAPVDRVRYAAIDWSSSSQEGNRSSSLCRRKIETRMASMMDRRGGAPQQVPRAKKACSLTGITMSLLVILESWFVCNVAGWPRPRFLTDGRLSYKQRWCKLISTQIFLKFLLAHCSAN